MSLDSSKKVPVLRFRDDEGKEYPNWKTRLLEDFVKFSKGRGISRADITDDGSCKCIRYGELYTLYKETISDVFSKTNVPVSQLFLSQKYDVVIPASGETALDIVSASCVLISGVALGGDVNVLRSQQNGIFLAYYLNSKRRGISRFAQGISVIHLYAVHLKRIPIALPCIQEQQKIALFLSSIDTRIEQLEKKKSLLEQYKKGLMQKLFSQEIRFKDDQGEEYPEWGEKQLGEISSMYKGQGLSKSETIPNGANPCILYGELFTIYGEVVHEVLNFTNIVADVCSKYGDVLMPDSDVTPDGLATASTILVDGAFIGGGTHIIRPNHALDPVFLSYQLNFNKKAILKLVTGTTVRHLYKKDIQSLPIQLPTKKEQSKIADFLYSVDKKIEFTSHLIHHVQAFKKGLVQQLFV